MFVAMVVFPTPPLRQTKLIIRDTVIQKYQRLMRLIKIVHNKLCIINAFNVGRTWLIYFLSPLFLRKTFLVNPFYL
ncbi:MAG: hypothetical protein DRJ36_02465 [Thermoprotei archaeon]|nr:MAG: hypothetical protein DRJ36_02465 [Thermoprotei archaeon]